MPLITNIGEWLVVWEAVSQYVDNSEDSEKASQQREIAERVLQRMDELFERSARKGMTQ